MTGAVSRRGDVHLADLGAPRGAEQGGFRPVVVLQDELLTQVWRTVVVIPFTTNLKLVRLPTCVLVPKGTGGLADDSVAMCHQIRALDRDRIDRRLGSLPPDVLTTIENALIRTLRL